MTRHDHTTEFLPAERAPAPALAEQRHAVSRSPMLPLLLDAVAEAVVILNDRRQIVYANRAFLELASDPGRVIGQRPGDALSCLRAVESLNGCGTTRFCRACGASRAIAGALNGHRRVEECRIIRINSAPEAALDLRVVATPFTHKGHEYVIFALTDIADEKRRDVLERLFLHDVGNTASIIHGAADMIADLEPREPEPVPHLVTLLNTASRRLLDEIASQRELAHAESGELSTHVEPLDTRTILMELMRMFKAEGLKRERKLVLAAETVSVAMSSDPTLLARVLANMIKNALEAAPPEHTVTVGCRRLGEGVQFTVHNPGVMPEAVQLQVFQRSFSTKGPGRGLGTYGMRLITERYLGGTVDFLSRPGAGTTFYATYPLHLETTAGDQPA